MADITPDELERALSPYRGLLANFVAGDIAAERFETDFLTRYKNDPTRWSRDVFDGLDAFFADVDDYVSDPDLRREVGGLDEEQLRERARGLLSKIASWVSATG